MRRKLLAAALAAAMLLGCSVSACAAGSSAGEVRIQLSDSGVKVDGKDAPTDTSSTVYVGGGIIYYAEGTDETYGAGARAKSTPPTRRPPTPWSPLPSRGPTAFPAP